MKNKISVLRDKALSLLLLIVGPVMVALGFTLGFVGLHLYGGDKELMDGVVVFVLFIFFGGGLLGLWLCARGNRLLKLVQDFRLYASILAQSENKSIKKIASALNIPVDTVIKKVQKMFHRHYFTGYLDIGEQTLVFGDASSPAAVRCPGCGASATVEGEGIPCPYCGTFLTK